MELGIEQSLVHTNALYHRNALRFIYFLHMDLFQAKARDLTVHTISITNYSPSLWIYNEMSSHITQIISSAACIKEHLLQAIVQTLCVHYVHIS